MAKSRLIVRMRSLTHSFVETIVPQMGRNNAICNGESPRCFGNSNEKVEKDIQRRGLGGEGFLRRGTIKDSIQYEIVRALYSGERNRASNLLSELVHADQDLKPQDFIYILEHCARYADPLFAMETWNHMDQKEVEVHHRCYFLTIRALCKGGYLKEAFNIVSNLEENSVMTPTLSVYNILLQACIEKHDLHYANECLHMMACKAVSKDEITYALLLKLAVWQQDHEAVKYLWEDSSKIYNQSIILLRKFIMSFTMLKDLESAYVALQKMVVVALQGDCRFGKTAEGKWYDLRLDILIPCHEELTWDNDEKNNHIPTDSLEAYSKEDESNKTMNQVKLGAEVKEVPTTGIKLLQTSCLGVLQFLRWSYNDVMHTCASEKNVLMAEQLLSQMQKLGVKPSSSTFDSYVRVLISEKSLEAGLEVLKVMQQNNLKPHESTLAVISASCSRARELDLAENFLDQIPNCKHAYPYNYFFEACDALDQLERAVRVLYKMKYLNVQPDIWTYELMFNLFVNVNSPYEEGSRLSRDIAAKRIKAIESDMMKHGIEHNRVSMQNLLKGLGMEGMMEELSQYLRIAETRHSYINSYSRKCIFESVMHPLVEAKETQGAISIFKKMLSSGSRPSAAIFTIMIECCSVIKCHKSACGLASMMIRCGFPLNAVTYTSLMKVFSGLENIDEALKLLELARSDGIQPDVQMYNTILRIAQTKGRIDVIELIVEKMHQEKIQPDTSTCARVFSAYVYKDYHTTGMEALQVLSMRMISEDDEILQQTKLQYENLIVDEDLAIESQIIRVFKTSPTLSMALIHLRWCAISGFPVLWSPNQSSWAKRLSSDYASRQAHSFIQRSIEI